MSAQVSTGRRMRQDAHMQRCRCARAACSRPAALDDRQLCRTVCAQGWAALLLLPPGACMRGRHMCTPTVHSSAPSFIWSSLK